MVAAAQWVSATESLQQMKELSGTDGWTLVHAFYALSGGFVLQTPDTETFPINAASVHYLVSRGYIALPSITREEIWDKSKADVFAKGLAILQGGWIIIQPSPERPKACRSRHSSSLPWPLVPGAMSKIWADAGYPEDMPYSGTPMDFVEKASQHWKRRSMFENFDLESAEQTVWRVCAVVLVAMSSAAVGLVRVLGQAKYRGRYNMLWVWVNADADAARPAAWDVLLGLTTLSLVLARCFLIMEVCISLRQLPARTFVDVDWTHYIPHV
ncbi:hypothetical protein B0T22DRAFT_509451 [Podospora appendiculata]|uniref:Uncharacterized protein n=1 Tax=Podospora appendiculata TaxID=314037 RepID=A0AAE0WZ41_9PEZI|nr:hypothetical protein B0T22DRAFT_509451 [Podospora appendiculata]